MESYGTNHDEEKVKAIVYLGARHLLLMEGSAGAGDARLLRYAIRKDPEGFDKGLVTNVEKASAALREWARTFFADAKHATALYVVLGNAKLRTYGFSSSQYFQGSPRTITAHEIRSVVNQTRGIATLPLSEFVLQALPESFLVNDANHIRNPLGLEAYRLGVQLKIFSMNFHDFKNISRAFEAADLEVKGFFPKTLTLSESVLSGQEKEQGAVLIDLSDASTEVILWKNGYLKASRFLQTGARTLTEKIASQWALEACDAEKVKDQYGSLETAAEFGEELIPLVVRNGKGSYAISRRVFQEIFLSQAKDWMKDLLTDIEAFAREEKLMHPRYVFTGGGARMDGFLEFLQGQFSRDARLGLMHSLKAPNEIIVNPAMTAALGIFPWLAANDDEQQRFLAPAGLLQRTLASARDWLAAYF